MSPSRTQIRTGIGVLAIAVALIAIGARPVRADTIALEQLPDANNHGDFVVGPGKQEMTLAPGQSETVDITIANRLGVDKIFTVTEEDFEGSPNPQQTVVLLGDDRGPYSLKDYIHPATTTIDIPNGYRARIPVVVSVPFDAQPGGLYGSIVIGTESKQQSTDSSQGAVPSAAVITQIGTLFFVTVPGPVDESGHVTQFSIDGGRSVIFDSSQVGFDILYRNDGTMYVDPSGTITVTNMLGATVGNLVVDPWFAMPQSLRFREVMWTPPFLFGRYTAHASVNRGYGSTTDEVDLVFWVIPWKIVLEVFLGLVIVIAIFRYIFSHFTIATKPRK